MAKKDPLQTMMNRFLILQGLEQLSAAATPYVQKGLSQAKQKAADLGADLMDKLPVEDLIKTAQSGKEAAAEAQQLAAELQATFSRKVTPLMDALESAVGQALGNEKIDAFRKDLEGLTAALREAAAPAAEEAAPEAPAAEEAAPVAKPKRTRAPRKPRGPKNG